MLSHRVKIFACIALISFCFWPVAGHTAGFDGDWIITYDCSGATGPYKDMCDQGVRDIFMLFSVTRHGDHICAYHLVTAHLGNRVDEGDLENPCEGPSVCGTVRNNTAIVYFCSKRLKTPGKAKITYNPHNDTLAWTLLSPSNESGWFPDRAVLKRYNKIKSRELDCSECAMERNRAILKKYET